MNTATGLPGDQTSRIYRVWLAIGVIGVSIQAWTLVRWITSPYFKPAPVGPDPISADSMLHVRVIEAASLVGFLVALWCFILAPLIRKRPLTSYGRVFIAMCSTYWLDPLYNYTNVTWYYNAYAFNMGSWASFIPGWTTPNHETFPEPLLGAGCLWFLAFGTTAKVGSIFYGKARAWFGPDALIRPVLTVFLAGTLLDAGYENLFIRMDVFGFQGTWGALTLWEGTQYQFPIYEPPMNGILMTAIVLLAYYRDDHGFMFCERGLNRLDISPARRSLLATLATCGFAQFFVVFGWMGPYQWFATHITTNTELPSYKLGGMCGKGTPYACPDGSFGIPTVYTRPEFIVHPDDPRLKKSPVFPD